MGLRVLRSEGAVPEATLERCLAKDDLRRLRERVTHWVEFEHAGDGDWSAAEIANLFVLALWLVKPTKAHIAFRFEMGMGELASSWAFFYLRDRMEWVSGAVAQEYDDPDMVLASRYFATLLTISRPGRLNDALVLTLQACWQGRWQGAIVLFSAAAEALLTWSKKAKLTRRLARTYAALTQSDANRRDLAYDEFVTCYARRSDIIHGRGTAIPETERLQQVARWATVVRSVWSTVLERSELLAILESGDAEREKHLAPCLATYTPAP